MALSDTKSIVPRADQQGTLGTATKSWGQLFIENPTDGGAAGVRINNLDVDQIALDINGSNTTANILDVTATALTTGNVVGLTNTDTLTGTSNKDIIFIDSNKSGVTGDGIVNVTTGITIDMDDTATNHTGALVTQEGINIDVNSSSADGTITNTGILVECANADNNTGIDITVPSGDPTNDRHLILRSAADNGDKCTFYTDTHGATTITTIDDDAAAAHLTFDIDGDIKFGGTSHTKGIRREVIALNNSSGAVDSTLTAAESGSLITIDPSTDNTNTIKITLPANATGINYKFVVTADASNTAADVLFTSASASNDFRGHFLATNAGVELVANACAFTLDVSVVATIGATSWEVVADGTFWAITGFYTGTGAQIGTSGDGLLLTNSTL